MIPAPTDVAVSDIDNESAVVTWTDTESFTYKLRYRTTGGETETEWIEIDTTEPKAVLKGLEAETEYEVQVRNIYGEYSSNWSDIVTFKTIDYWSLPTQLAATDITTDAATINWNGHADSYYLRYRTIEHPAGPTFFEDFEGLENEGALPEGWTTIDADGDGYTWYPLSDIDKTYGKTHSGTGLMTSASWINGIGGLTPDNWLISPKVTLEGTLKAWLSSQNTSSYIKEHFAIYVSTKGNTDVADFEEVLDEQVTNGAMTEYTVDLSSYEGQEGYVAIRHFNCFDQIRINLDDVGIYVELTPTSEWSETVGNIDDLNYRLTDLQEGTYYEVQMGAYYLYDESIGMEAYIEWTPSLFFRTESEENAINDLAADVKAGRQDIYTLTGIRLKAMPTQRGFYIVNGKKVFIK